MYVRSILLCNVRKENVFSYSLEFATIHFMYLFIQNPALNIMMLCDTQ